MGKVYIVNLVEEERRQLIELTQKGHTSARTLKRAHILLLADAGKTDAEIAQILHTNDSTVKRTRERYVKDSLERALYERPRSGRPAILDGKREAYLIALACSTPPAGRKCWTMQLLADRLVELTDLESISDETVRTRLKKRSQALAAQRVVYPAG